MMKKFFFTCLFVLTTVAAIAQTDNTIEFLGIPVDGNKNEMISKLQVKGYEYDASSHALLGEFNGDNVAIFVQTVNNRVWRIMIVDAEMYDNEASIKFRYNRLFEQLSNNGKYEVVNGSTLDEKEDILSYQMLAPHFTFKDKSIHGCVWYTIIKLNGKYGIMMFYENLDNAAREEDL